MSFYDDVMRMERERTGNYGQDKEERIPPRCPVCNKRHYDCVLRNIYGKIIGCSECVKEDYDWGGE